MEMDKAVLDHQTRVYFDRLSCSDPAHKCQDSEEERIARKRCKADKKYMVDSKGKPYTVHTSSAAKGRVDTEMTKILVEEVQAKAARDRAMGLKMPVLDDAARSTSTSSDGKVALRTPTPRKVTFDVPGAYPTQHATNASPIDRATSSVHASGAAPDRIGTPTTKNRVEEVQVRNFRPKATGGYAPRIRAAASPADGKDAIPSPTPNKVAFDVSERTKNTAVTTSSTTAASSAPIYDAEMAAKRRAPSAPAAQAPKNTTNTVATGTTNSPGPYTSTPGGKCGIKTTTTTTFTTNAAAGGRLIPIKRLAPSPLAAEHTPGARESSNKNVDALKVPESTAAWTTSDGLPTAKVKVVEMPVRAPKVKGRKGTEGEGKGEGEGEWVDVDLEDDDWELV